MHRHLICRSRELAAIGAAVIGAGVFAGSVRAASEPIQPSSCAARPGPAAEPSTYVTPAGRVPGGYGVALPTGTVPASALSPCDVPRLDDAYRAAGIVGTYVTPRRNVKGAYGVALPIVTGLNDGRVVRVRGCSGTSGTADVSKYLPSRTPTARGFLGEGPSVGAIYPPSCSARARAAHVDR